MPQNYGLGRGLSSLIPQKKKDDSKSEESGGKREDFKGDVSAAFRSSINPVIPANDILADGGGKNISEVKVGEIIANPYQPRINFDKEKLEELSNSIKNHGIIQPLIVTKKGEKFELVAGERRFQAAKLAGIEKVPVIVKEIDNKEKLELAIIENIQRHDLSPIEEAKSYHKLISEFKMSQEEVANKMGKSRSAVANKIRLLSLSIDAVRALNEGKITEGHAKVILSLDDKEKQKALLELIIKKHLTVRQTENKIKEISVRPHMRKIIIDPETKELEERFSSALGTKVKVKKSGGEGGKITIDYYSKEELDGIIQKIGK